MKRVIINANQKGILYINGAVKAILGAGKYYTTSSRTIEILPVTERIQPEGCTVEQLLKLDGAENSITTVEVGADEIVFHLCGGNYADVLEAGKHAFWRDGAEHELRRYSTAQPELSEEAVKDVTACGFAVSNTLSCTVNEHEQARMYLNGRLERLLGAGKYYFWSTDSRNVRIETEDLREQKLEISGQEILTADKVSVRVNFVVFYKVTDAQKIADVTADIRGWLYAAAQLVLREYISKYKMDEILENRERISDEVITALRGRTAAAFVEIISAGVKDIILPGEISAIMNSVLAAEKRAQANVITRREEVASTRSLLNTAKLMEENATLRKLKELEYLERICENVGGITVDGTRDLLSQLTAVVTGQ